MLVEDSATDSYLLSSLVQDCPDLNLCAVVNSGEKALEQIQSLRPDVISMDLHLPGMNGLQTTQAIMQACPTPIVIVSSEQDLNLGFQALQVGALTVIKKPVGPWHAEFIQQHQQFCTQLKIMSQVRVVRQRPRPTRQTKQPYLNRSFQYLAIIASTGGPRALETVLSALGADFPLPVLVVQHISADFFSGFVDWLNSVCPLKVLGAQAGDWPLPGHVYLAPPEQHMLLQHGKITLQAGDKVNFQQPSGSVLLQSMANSSSASQSVGVVLTGMGSDGASGLLALRQAGGYTLAESAASAIVYGMPKVAADIGAVDQVLALDEMGPFLLHLTRVVPEHEPDQAEI